MTTNTLSYPEQKIQLTGITWQTYETLLKELSDRRLRLTYYRGNLEIMTPSPEHEFYKILIGRFAETLAEELKINIYPLGSTTFKRPENSGAEPDQCFYIQNIKAIKGKKRLDLSKDPAPDLVIEIDITSSSQNRLDVYADLGVSEIWSYNGKSFTVMHLENQQYIVSQQSLAFPNIPIQEIARFLEQATNMEYLELVSAFRTWVKSQIYSG